MSADFSNVTKNIIAEAARRGMTRTAVHSALGWSYGPWNARQKNPAMWTIGELVRVAAILEVPMYSLLGTVINAFPHETDEGIKLGSLPITHEEDNE